MKIGPHPADRDRAEPLFPKLKAIYADEGYVMALLNEKNDVAFIVPPSKLSEETKAKALALVEDHGHVHQVAEPVESPQPQDDDDDDF